MERDHLFDSLKFVLVCLVVFVHFISNKEVLFNAIVYDFLMSFVMPLFTMVSGYFSKNITWKKYKKSFVSLFLVYVVFQFTYFIPLYIAGNVKFVDLFLTTRGGLWYIVGLILWRLFICGISLLKVNFFITMMIALAISISLGFIDVIIFSSRILTFLPFFVVGYYCPKDWVAYLRSINRVFSVLGLILILCLVIFFTGKYYTYTIFGEYPYIYYPSLFYGIFARLLLYPFTILSSVFVFNLVTDYFYKFGNKTMDIFLLHICFIPVYHIILLYLGITVPIWVDVIVSFVVIMICLYLSKLKWVQYWVNPILIISK